MSFSMVLDELLSSYDGWEFLCVKIDRPSADTQDYFCVF